jgi:hypothetical protein
LQNNQSNTIFWLKNQSKTSPFNDKTPCHLNSDLKFNEKTIEFANQFGDNQFTYDININWNIFVNHFFTNRSFEQQSKYTGANMKNILLINKNQLNNYDGFILV